MTAPADLVFPPERTRPDDRYHDFCLWPYSPLRAPAGRLRSAELLFRTFDLEGVGAEGRALCDALRQAFGLHNTVWGVKQAGGALSWEIYVYDYARTARARSIPRFVEALAPHMPCALSLPDARPYFMFSAGFDAQALRAGAELTEIDVYTGNPGSSVSSGVCHRLNAAGLELKNFYFFFDAATEREAALGKLMSSPHIGEGEVWPAALAWPEMMGCKTVVVANKRASDGLYFSRVDVRALGWFLRRTGFREDVARLVTEDPEPWSHLLFDTGWDFTLMNGQPIVLKSAFYGHL
ncbi:hypothetical protein P2H44_20610 [Albimonas sp. CAU 1670]|uniref:hypothetical protein n=1 Tax=Albimonas sp. CAU 1670 TaxID=3032599 RepID=UPI0023DCDE61|nr:hypothetical protein [Albimonas sp. CAU 1670]MDF2234969.1 hypothetical protein [Albimonas sp. CAU 1670]